MSFEVGKIVGYLDIDDRKFNSKIDKGGSKFKDFGGKLLKTGVAMAAGVGAAVGVAGVAVFGHTKQLEAMGNKARIVFGAELTVVEQWAKKSSAAMGLTNREATGLAANFADLLIPMGFTRKQAAAMSTDVVGLSGALSQWTGGTKSAAEVSEILAKAMLGEREGLKELGISIQEADVDARLLAKGQDKLTGATREQARALATSELIFEKSADAQAAYAGQSNKVLTATNNLKAGAKELWDELSVRLLPVFTALAQWAADKMPGIERLVIAGFDGIDAAIVKPVRSAYTFLASLNDIAGWTGADLTGKIKISWGALSDQFEDWMNSPEMTANLSRPWEVKMGMTGEEKLTSWGGKVGELAAGALKAALGLGGVGDEKAVWGRAGRAMLQGFKDAFMETDWKQLFWDSFKGIAEWNKDRTLEENAWFKEKVGIEGIDIGPPTPQWTPENKGAFFTTWTVKDWETWLNTPIGESVADKAGETVGPPLGTSTKDTALKHLGTIDNWMRPFVKDAPGTGTKIGTGVGGAVATAGPKNVGTIDGWMRPFVAGAPAEGNKAGTAYGTGWVGGANAVLKNWDPPSLGGIADGWLRKGTAGGSGFGESLTAELDAMMPKGGGFAGLSPHMNQLAGSISAMFGLDMGSGFRPGATIRNTGKPSLHGSGRGTDWFGSSSQLWKAFEWLAANAGSFGIQELLYRGKAWSSGVPYVHANTNAQSVSDHMDHLHVGTRYHGGGEVPAVLKVGERVLTQEQNTWMDRLTKSAKGGGGGITVNIKTLNATNPAAAGAEIVRVVNDALGGSVRRRRLAPVMG